MKRYSAFAIFLCVLLSLSSFSAKPAQPQAQINLKVEIVVVTDNLTASRSLDYKIIDSANPLVTLATGTIRMDLRNVANQRERTRTVRERLREELERYKDANGILIP